jgi:Bacterial Ig-like domain (group 3)
MRIRRTLAMVAAATIAGAGIVGLTATPASAAVTFSPSTGNDSTLVNVNDTVGCPAGSIEASVGFQGPGSDYLTAGEGAVGVPAASGPYALQFAIANLRTATATFGTGPFPQSYDLLLLCTDPAANVTTDTIGRLTVTGQGTTADTFSIVPVVAAQDTTTTLTANPTTAEQGAPVTLTAAVAPAAATGSVEFFNGTTSLGTDATAPYEVVTNALPVGTNNVTAVFTGGAGFNDSTSAPVAVTITAVAPRPTTTTIDSVTPLTGDAFAPTTVLCTVDAATGSAVGTLQFRANGAILGTVPVSADGQVSFTTNAIGAGTAINVDCNFVGTAPYQNSTSAQIAVDRVAVGATDEQTIIVEIPAGAITITTPYTPASPLNLGTAVLDQTDSTYSASALFDKVTISDTRSGALGFEASLIAGPFASATDSFPGAHAGFVSVTPIQVPGNALQASNVVPTNWEAPATAADVPGAVAGTNSFGLGVSRKFADYAPGQSLGTVDLTATFEVDSIPTSKQPGVYTSTVTFTAI